MIAKRKNQIFICWSVVIATFVIVLLFSSFQAAAQTQDVVWQQPGTGEGVTFSADGFAVLAGNQLRQASDGALLRAFNIRHGAINCVALSNDGLYAAVGTQSNLLNLDFFRISDGMRIVPTDAHNNGTTTLKFSPDSQLLASGGRDGTVKIWHVPDMTLVNTFLGGPGYNARVFALLFSNDGQYLAVGGQGGAKIMRVSDGAQVQRLVDSGTVQALALSPDGLILAGAFFTAPYAINFWRFPDGLLINSIQVSNQPLNALAYQPDGQIIASGGGDDIYSGIVRFFSTTDSTQLGFFPQDPNNGASYVTSIAYSPDGELIAYARADQLTIVARNPFACRMELSPKQQLFPPKGGVGSVTLAACNSAWKASSDVKWLTITSAAEGNGDGIVDYSVEKNTASKTRIGMLHIGTATLTVTQESAKGNSRP